MKNKFEVWGDKTIIYLKRKDGTILETTIDTSDSEKAMGFPNTWSAYWNRGSESFYVQGSMMNDEKRITVQLHRWILEVTDKDKVVDHINHNPLD